MYPCDQAGHISIDATEQGRPMSVVLLWKLSSTPRY